jgi:hypothetical protein
MSFALTHPAGQLARYQRTGEPRVSAFAPADSRLDAFLGAWRRHLLPGASHAGDERDQPAETPGEQRPTSLAGPLDPRVRAAEQLIHGALTADS